MVANRLVGRAGVLRQQNFRRFYIGYSASLFGTGMEPVGVAFAVLAGGGSAADLGFLLTAGVAANVLCLLAGGVVADRFSRRSVMLVCDSVRFVGELTFAALVLFGHPAMHWLIPLYALQNAAVGFYTPALSGLTPQLVAADDLHDANVFVGLARDVGRVLGPAAAGAVVAVADAGAVLAIDAVTFGISAVSLASLRLATESARAPRSPLRDLAEGWAAWRAQSWIWITGVKFTLFNSVVYAPLIVLGPLVAKTRFGGAADWGIVLAALGIGAVASTPFIIGRRPSRPLLVITLMHALWASPLLAMALRLPLPAIAVGAFLAGIGSATFNAIWSATLQQHVAPGLLSRVASFSFLCAYSLSPLGLAIAAPVAKAIGTSAVLGFGAAWQVASSLVVLALPSTRRFGRPADPQGQEQPGQQDATA